jgi:CRP-like cAMP-binding protein
MSVVHRGPLARLKPFRGVDPAHVQALEQSGRWEQLEAGAPVTEQGDTADTAMLLVEGRMRVRVAESDRDLGDLWPGSVIGENALFGVNSARSYSVRTVVPSRVLHLRREDLRALSGSPAVAALQRHVIAVTARRLQTADLDMRKVWRDEDQARFAASRPAAPSPEPASAAGAGGLFDRLKALIGVSS